MPDNNVPMKPHTGAILDAVLAAADPAAAVARALAEEPVQSTTLFATGKASIAMARAAIERCDITRGVITGVPEHAEDANLPEHIEVFPADHPLPTARNQDASVRVEAFMRELDESDSLLALISGGGSAHLCSPANGITLHDLRTITNALFRAGATINELNAVRKHCERLNGGNLARLASPATIHCLVISDVIGDRLDTISSGPFAPDESTYTDALGVLDRCGATDLAPSIRDHLLRGVRGEIPETPKPADPCFSHVTSRIIASNRVVVDAAAAEANRLGYATIEIEYSHTGSACDLGRYLARKAIEYKKDHADDPAAIIVGGETTVNVENATGLGGRNQEVALAGAIELEGTDSITLLSFATDGIDGPTDAAGAIVTAKTANAIRAAGIDPTQALANHDSHTALDAANALIRTGPTGTNVNDIAIALIVPAS